MRPLEGLRVLDLTHRLPGPLAGMLLSQLGAEVTKLEDEKHKDAFLEGFFASFDTSFVEWYHELNDCKKVSRINFKAENIRDLAKPFIENADIVLLSLSPKLKTALGFDGDELKKIKRPLVVLDLEASSTHKKAMHDLNALAEAGFMHLHVAGQHTSPLAPPFLPIAGISFGQQVALNALALFQKAQREKSCIVSKTYLFDEIVKVFAPFWPKKVQEAGQQKFLHNGAYPCYSLYQTKDGDWLAVAAVEEKFWQEFVQILGLNLTDGERFDTSEKTFNYVAQAVKARSTQELAMLLDTKDICVSLIRITK